MQAPSLRRLSAARHRRACRWRRISRNVARATGARIDPAQESARGHDPSHEGPSMRKSTAFALLLASLAVLWGCSSNTVVVSVPPRMQLQNYGTLGLVQFDSNSHPGINEQTTREFESHLHSAQPGTRIVELGSREQLLA